MKHRAWAVWMLAPVAWLGAAAHAAWQPGGTAGYCQILDHVARPIYEFRLTVIPESGFAGYGDSGFLEIAADWDVAYFRGVALGDVEMNLRSKLTLLTDSARLELPDQVAMVAADIAWTGRYEGGYGVQARVKPGIYSDIEELGLDALAFPFSGTFIYAFDPAVSGMIGLEIRPGFERLVMPILGVAWEIRSDLRLEAGLPRTRLQYYAAQGWSTHLGFDWENVSYELREKGSFDRKQMTLEDYRLYWGLTRRVSDQMQLTFELGRAFERSVEFEAPPPGQPGDIAVDEAVYLKAALGGPF
jgi:hypothetical protein